jgi:hypothetical protein
MRKILSSVVAASTIFAASAFATNDVQNDNVGNYLVTPMFSTVGGFKSEMRLINTQADKAYVVKVVTRENVCSTEKNDFIVYLSPGDVFDMSIAASGDSDINIMAEAENVKSAYPSTGKVVSGIKSGYVEYFVLAEYDAVALDATFKVGNPLAKSKIIEAYDAATAGNPSISENAITGNLSLIDSSNARGMTVPLIAVGFEHLAGNVFGEETQNTKYDVVLTSTDAVEGNLQDELMTALQKTNVMISYDASVPSILNMAFIGANDLWNITDKAGNPVTCDATNGYAGTITFAATIRDVAENTIKPDTTIFSGETISTTVYNLKYEVSGIEVNQVVASTGFASGYADIELDTGNTVVISGVDVNKGLPVIPSYMQLLKVSDTASVTNMYYPAYK